MTIDDLQSVAAAHLEERTREAADAESMIAREVDRYQLRLRTVDVTPAIVGLQQRAEEFRRAELRRMQARLGSLSSEQTAAVEAMSRSLVNKLLHAPMQALKQAARDGDAARVEAIRDSFALGSELKLDSHVREIGRRADSDRSESVEPEKVVAAARVEF